VKELLKLIDQIRARYPEKQDISSLDILKYVQELNGGTLSGGPYGGGAWPYRTFNMWLLQHHRRNTLGKSKKKTEKGNSFGKFINPFIPSSFHAPKL
jgi:hypothetical protein